MTASSAFTSLLWFLAILALIPAALWLLKRTPAGGAATHGAMRTVAVLSLSPPSASVVKWTGISQNRSLPSRRKKAWSCTCTTT